METDFSTRDKMIPKNKIRLSRHLYAQTTPYPQIKRWVKRGIIISVLILGLGIYFVTKKTARDLPLEAGNQQILGEQERTTKSMIYQVKKGDTLFNLSQTYGVGWQTLAEINGLSEPYTLKIGQKIKIPVPK